MAYNEKINLKLYKYEHNNFTLQAIIDDVQQASFEHNYYAAGQFTITINYNIPNAKLFERGLFVQFGDSPYDFGEITSITNSIGENGKGSEFVNITGYDARYLFKRRIISALNDNDKYTLTADGETCIRSLISSQCTGKRSLPVEMGNAGTLGETFTVSESYSNLYDVLQTVATQTNIGWRLKFSSGTLTLEVYQGEDKSKSVFFSEEMDSLKNGTYQDSNTSYANAILIAGKGSGSERDIYEGEELIDGDSPAGLDRFEAFDNQAELTTQEEYENEADAMLRQYSQTLTVQGAGLIKSPYVFREQYDIGDYITLNFSDKTAKVQITSVTEQISWNSKTLSFTFGKPVNGLDRQLDLMLKKIQSASSAISEASTNSVKWYTTPTDTAQESGDVTFNTLGFTGSGGTFTLYLDDEKTGSKSYHLYIKNLTASLVLTTNKGATDLTLISGSYIANIFVDEDGNIINQGMTATNSVTSGNTQPVTSDAVSGAIDEIDTALNGKVNTTDIIPINRGGTNGTTAKEAEYNLIGNIETVETEPDDNRYIALRNQTLSSTDGTFRWTKCSSIWNWIRSKIIEVFYIKRPSDSQNYVATFQVSLSENSSYRKTILLLCDITALDGVSSNGSSYGFVGNMYAHRRGGFLREHCSSWKITAAWQESNTLGRSTLQLCTTDNYFVPIKIHNESTGKTYLGIRYNYSLATSCIFIGSTQNMPDVGYVGVIHLDDSTNEDSNGVTWTEKCTGLTGMLNIELDSTSGGNALTATSATTAETANKIRTSAPSSPSNGDIWIS